MNLLARRSDERWSDPDYWSPLPTERSRKPIPAHVRSASWLDNGQEYTTAFERKVAARIRVAHSPAIRIDRMVGNNTEHVTHVHTDPAMHQSLDWDIADYIVGVGLILIFIGFVSPLLGASRSIAALVLLGVAFIGVGTQAAQHRKKIPSD